MARLDLDAQVCAQVFAFLCNTFISEETNTFIHMFRYGSRESVDVALSLHLLSSSRTTAHRPTRNNIRRDGREQTDTGTEILLPSSRTPFSVQVQTFSHCSSQPIPILLQHAYRFSFLSPSHSGLLLSRFAKTGCMHSCSLHSIPLSSTIQKRRQITYSWLYGEGKFANNRSSPYDYVVL